MPLVLLSLLLVFQTPTNPTNGHATVETRTDVGWVGPEQKFYAIVLITPENGWHVYWKDSGASGAPTVVETSAPEGYVVGDPIFPRPKLFYGKEGVTYGYDEQAAIFIPITSPNEINTDEITLDIKTYWLACKKVCVIGEDSNTLTVSTKQTKGPAHRDMRLVKWKQRLPKKLDDLKDAKVIFEKSKIQISGVTTEDKIQFVGLNQLGVRFLDSEVVFFEQNKFTLTVPLELDFSLTDMGTFAINGLLLIGGNDTDPCYVVQIVANPDTIAQ